MADNGGQEKTEQPTAKRRKDARKEGNVFQSKDVANVVTLFGVVWFMQLAIPSIYKKLRLFVVQFIEVIGTDPADVKSLQLFDSWTSTFLRCALPLLLVSLVLAVLSHAVQTRFLFTFYVLKPKFSRMNPLNGIKHMFSMKNVVELLKNIAKCVLLIILLYTTITGALAAVVRMYDMEPTVSASYMFDLIFSLVKKVCLVFSVVAFFDFLYQRYKYEKDLKMTKQEVKEEHKEQEGDPKTKGRIRRIQRQMVMSRMMQKVPEADVIIRNPTHLAIALKYDPQRGGAPVVLAKGQDELALRIVKTGEEHQVFILENKPLARAMYDSCELDREIPAEFYGAVAEILVYIYKISGRQDMFLQ